MYSVRIDNRGFDKKPTNIEIIKINKRLSENAAVCVNWDEFCSLVGEKGHSFCVSDFSGNIRRKEFFSSQQIFALDFDGGITYEEIISRMKKLRIPIALSYETFSSKNLDKFRIVLLHDSIITDIHISELITDVLLYLFPEADSHCRDVSRIFFWRKKVTEL